MPKNYYENPMSDNECLNYIRPCCKSQRIQSFTGRTPVTLRNPQRIKNNLATDAVISMKLREDTAFIPYLFAARESMVCDVVEVGSSADGTTSTDVVVHGIE